MKSYIVSYITEFRQQKIARVYADRNKDEIAKWFLEHWGATSVVVKCDDNPNASEAIIRL